MVWSLESTCTPRRPTANNTFSVQILLSLLHLVRMDVAAIDRTMRMGKFYRFGIAVQWQRLRGFRFVASESERTRKNGFTVTRHMHAYARTAKTVFFFLRCRFSSDVPFINVERDANFSTEIYKLSNKSINVKAVRGSVGRV